MSMSYDQLVNFIVKVFNYYNGKINTLVKANLNICNMRDSGTNFPLGSCSYPNIVTIFPYLICANYDSGELAALSVVTVIIHELFHVDQSLLYKEDGEIKYYKFENLEDKCRCISAMYYINNIAEITYLIRSEFGIDTSFIREFIDTMYRNDIKQIVYLRRSLFEHYVVPVEHLLDDAGYDRYTIAKVIDGIKCLWEQNDTNIVYEINGCNYYIKCDDKIMNLDDFNSIIFYNLFNHIWSITRIKHLHTSYIINDKEFIMFIKLEYYNQMVHVIDNDIKYDKYF